MGFIIIGILIAAGFFIYSFFIKIKPDTVARLVALILFVGLFAGVFIPTGEDRPIEEIRTIELRPLNVPASSAGNDTICYVSINGKNDYLYYMQEESDFATENSKAYATKCISSNKVTIVEEENCEVPRLIEYKNESATFWSLGVLGTEDFYVFYIPKDSITYGLV